MNSLIGLTVNAVPRASIPTNDVIANDVGCRVGVGQAEVAADINARRVEKDPRLPAIERTVGTPRAAVPARDARSRDAAGIGEGADGVKVRAQQRDTGHGSAVRRSLQ